MLLSSWPTKTLPLVWKACAVWGRQSKAVWRLTARSAPKDTSRWCNLSSLPEIHHVRVAVSSRTPIHGIKHVMLRDALISLCCLHLPKKCQCWFCRRERSKEWWCPSFSPHSAEAAGCSFRILNNCTVSKQGRWSIRVSGQFCRTGEAVPAHGHF